MALGIKQFLIESLIGRAPLQGPRPANATAESQHMWLVKWSGYVYVLYVHSKVPCTQHIPHTQLPGG